MLPETAQASYQMKGSIECPDSPFCASAENEEIAKSPSTTTSNNVRPVERRGQLDNLDVKTFPWSPLQPSIYVLRVTKSDEVKNTTAPTNPFKE